MQMRRPELPGQTYWQRLATPGTAKALRWLFLGLSGAKNRDASSRTLDAGKVDRPVHCSMLIWPAQPHSFWPSLAKLFEIADSDAKIFCWRDSYLLGVAAKLSLTSTLCSCFTRSCRSFASRRCKCGAARCSAGDDVVVLL